MILIIKNYSQYQAHNFKVWILSDSDTEEEDNIGTDDPESIDSDKSESLSYSVYKIWEKRQLHISTDFSVAGCMLSDINQVEKPN